MKRLSFLGIAASLIGASLISIDLGIFQLSLFRIIILLISVIMCTEVLANRGKISLNLRNRNRYSLIFMLVWVAYAFVTLGWVHDYVGWVRHVYFIVLGVLSILIFNKLFKSSTDILNAFRTMGLVALFHNALGWYEVVTSRYHFLHPERVPRYSRMQYPVTSFGNTNDFATFMVFAFFILYICAVNSKTFATKSVYIFGMISSLLLVNMTRSRANIVGMLLAFIVFAYLLTKTKKGRIKLTFFLIALLVLAMLNLGVLTTLYMALGQQLVFRFGSGTGSDSIRTNLIKNGLEFLISTFGFGTGAGNIEHWMEFRSQHYTGLVRNIHNWWMEILVGYGLIIFTLNQLLYGKLVVDLYKKYRVSTSKLDQSISLGSICCMVAYVVGSISSSTNMSSEWLWVFWGVLIAYQGTEMSSVSTLLKRFK